MAVEKTGTHFNSVELAYEEESPLLEYNKLDISQLEEDDNLSEMTIRVKTEYGNNFTYNTFIVTSCKA